MAEDRFENFKDQLRNIARPLHFWRKDKLAFCLAGGGITGAMYEIGCLTALDDFLEPPANVNKFEIYVGTSAGAVVAALLANGYTPRELFEGIMQEKGNPLNFKRSDIYTLRWTEFGKAVLPLLARIPKLLHYGWKNRRQASLLDLLSILQEFIPPGLFSLSNLDKFVASLLEVDGKSNDFRALTKELYIPATDLDTGRRHIFGEEDADDVAISRAVAASTAIPIFFQPFRIKGRDYIDGSTSQVAHMDVALRHGARLIIILNPTVPLENDRNRICLPTFHGHCARLRDKGVSFISEQARRIETKGRFELGFARFKNEHPDVDYIVIQPQSSDAVLFLHGVMEFESRKLILNHSYNMTMAQLKANRATYQKLFEKHNLKIRPQFRSQTPAPELIQS